MNGISLLAGLPYVDRKRIGTLGHSMGGNTVLFLAALDDRISFACASGSTCTYEHRLANGVGIEMASVIPGFHGPYDIDDLVSLTAPRKLLLVSAEEDKYSMDAPAIVEAVCDVCLRFASGKAYGRHCGGVSWYYTNDPAGASRTEPWQMLRQISAVASGEPGNAGKDHR